MSLNEIDAIKEKTKQLRPDEKVELIKFLADSLSSETLASTPITFGRFRSSGRRMSTAEDFEIAEWRPTDRELNGN